MRSRWERIVARDRAINREANSFFFVLCIFAVVRFVSYEYSNVCVKLTLRYILIMTRTIPVPIPNLAVMITDSVVCSIDVQGSRLIVAYARTCATLCIRMQKQVIANISKFVHRFENTCASCTSPVCDECEWDCTCMQYLSHSHKENRYIYICKCTYERSTIVYSVALYVRLRLEGARRGKASRVS